MNKKDTIVTLCLIALISYFSFKLGQGDPIVIEKIVEIEVTDKGFCYGCHKEHSWDEMYALVNDYDTN